MRVFVTGATGFIGSAVVRELQGAGHEVAGLARCEQAAAALKAAGVAVRRGSLAELDVLYDAARESDGVIHTAFVHDFANFAAAAETDRVAVETLGAALAGTQRPLVITSGTALVASDRPVTEEAVTEEAAADPTSPRGASEAAALSFAAREVRVSVVRLPLSVHGEGDRGFVPSLISIARSEGVCAYIGDGANRWPAVHRGDAARLFRLALEAAPACARWHGVAEQAIPFRAIAEVIGRRLNLPVTAVSREQADAHFDWLAAMVAMDNPASSARTRTELGWHPVRRTLLAELGESRYFGE